MLGWGNIIRLCLVNAAIGGLTALPVNLFNRLMTVELALPAMLPGLLVALHYAVQLSRPVWGHRSDRTGARTPVILGGMAALCCGVIAAAWAVALPTGPALAVWVLAYIAIGLGVGAAGTSFLALLAAATAEARRPAAATLAWLMLIAGAIAASVGAGILLEPYSPERLLLVVSWIAGVAALAVVLATLSIEKRNAAYPDEARPALRAALRATWADPAARRFTGFVFLSIFAFYLSELIFEPFAGHVHGLSPEASTKLSGGKDGAALLGMIAAGALASFRIGSLRAWAVVGCVLSAVGLVALGAGLPLMPATVTLGLGNGLFVVGAIGSMMRLASARRGSEGATMGVFGASQAIAAGAAGLLATGLLDALTAILPRDAAYGILFTLEAAMFLAAAVVAARILTPKTSPSIVPGE
ncbi:MAG: MFS transporter [Pseudomonadota bacterium]